MGKFKAKSPKPHLLYSNDEGMVAALCEKAAHFPHSERDHCTTKTTTIYRDRNGKKRCVGKKEALRESQ